MAPGSVIVDLAAERGGNCELTRPARRSMRQRRDDPRPDQSARVGALPRQPDVRDEYSDLPQIPVIKDGKLNIDREDEIIRETLVTHEGEVVNPNV